jgi:DNA polymerase V
MTNRFTDEPQYSNSVTMSLSVATQDTAELIRYACKGIEQLFREGYGYKKAGVILTALVSVSQVQTHLFDQKDRDRSQRLMTAIDAIYPTFKGVWHLPAYFEAWGVLQTTSGQCRERHKP